MAKSKKQEQLENQLAELTADLQRTRADFENYRKRSEADREAALRNGKASAILKLLPVIDNIERAIGYVPSELKDNKWALGVSGLAKNLEKLLEGLDVRRILATPGTIFDPELHEAIQVEESGEAGGQEVIAEELQAGYTLGGMPIRYAMVKVIRK